MWHGLVLSVAIVSAAAWALLTDVETGAATSVAVATAAIAGASRKHVRVTAAIITMAALSAANASVARRQALAVGGEGPGVGEGGAAGDGPIALIEGTLVSDATLLPDGSVRLLVNVSAIEQGARRTDVRFRVQAYVAGSQAATRAATWIAGRHIRTPISLRRPSTLRNPGGWSARWQTLRRGFHLTGNIKSAWLVTTTPGSRPREAVGAVRRAVRAAIVRSTRGRSTETRAVLLAILLGDRTGIADDLAARLQRAGTYHVIAISGGNVALLVLAAMMLARLCFRTEHSRTAIVLAVVITYGGIAGGDPSVNRAVSAAVIYLVSRLAGLHASPAHVVALVAAVVAVAHPVEVLAPGAWLSYGATIGIIVFAGTWARRLVDPPGAPRTRIVTLGRAATGVLVATAAVELILLPVSASLFGRVGIAGLLLNVVAIPAMAVVQASGMAAVAASFVWGPVAEALATISEAGVSAITTSARLVDVAPWLSWRVMPPAWPWLVVFYLSLATAWACRGHRQLCCAGAVSTGLCAVGLLLSPERILAAPPPEVLRLTMIDVGQGESLFVQFPTGQSLLVDAGNASSTYDVGERVVVPAVQALGTRRLDWLAVTHADLDHIGGAHAVADALDVREIWDAVPVPRSVEWSVLREAVARRGGVWRQLQAGHRIDVADVAIEVLHPPRPDWERQKVRNDDSLVLRVHYRDIELLLTGDIGPAVEDELQVSQERPLRLLKIAHHGSRSSTGATFVRRYDPLVGLISAGASNAFGHPAAAVLNRLDGRHAHVFRTDLSGAVIVETDGDEIHVRTWAGQTWQAAFWRSSS